jgi:predicted nucleic acid-binding protein
VSQKRFFLDTFYVQALLNSKDQYHTTAMALLPQVQAAAQVVVTEAVLIELGNALSVLNRSAVVEFIRSCYRTANILVVPVDSHLFRRAVALYDQRQDKEWGLTDCISFVVMDDENLVEALTGDRHFAQPGYKPIMTERNPG